MTILADFFVPAEQEYSRYWLHVADDGTERRFAERPDNIPTSRVGNDGEHETTHTYDREEEWGRFVPVPPPGEGWVYCPSGKSWSTRWIRPINKKRGAVMLKRNNSDDFDNPGTGPARTDDTKPLRAHDYFRANGSYAYTTEKGENPDGTQCWRTRRYCKLSPGACIEPGRA